MVGEVNEHTEFSMLLQLLVLGTLENDTRTRIFPTVYYSYNRKITFHTAECGGVLLLRLAYI